MTQLPPSAGNQPPPTGAPPPPPPPFVYVQAPPPRRRLGVWVLAILLLGSIMLNVLMLIVVGFSGDIEQGGAAAARPLQETVVEQGDANNRIAIIRISGIITEGTDGGLFANEGTDYHFVKRQVEQALNDAHVKAVVLAVNSPGGGASASDMMLHELKKLKDADPGKPVIVHMGSVAASGGYYVSMVGDKIIAQPTCITGSIGVIGQFITMHELMKDKLGIQTYTVKSGPMKDVGNPFRDMTAEEFEYLHNSLIMPMYDRFIDMVVEGRPNLSRDEILELADGRIYTAQQALKDGLIDKIGFQEDAIKEAETAAGISGAQVVQYSRKVTFLDLLGLSAQARNQPLININRDTLNSLSTPQILMLWKM